MKSGKVWQSFYYSGIGDDGRRKEIPLGPDLNEAKRKWAELECRRIPPNAKLMRLIFDRYERQVIPTKAQRTQVENLRQLAVLRRIFNGAPINSITPQIIAQYRDQRGQDAPVAANRELALFSHVFNMAREWGYTEKENPVRGVRKNKERGRDYYADGEVWNAVYREARPELQDAMDLSYLTGQRPADVMKMRFSDIRDGALVVKQNKTGHGLRILLVNEEGGRTQLGQLIERIRLRPRQVVSIFLVAGLDGRAISPRRRIAIFNDAREKAAALAEAEGKASLAQRIRAFQFRDIRPKAASETDLAHASKLLGHTEQEITKRVYRRAGDTVMPTK